MPDVLMLAVDDWANTGWRFFKCIQKLGIDILGLKGEFHRMAYPEQLPIHPILKGITGYPANVPLLKEYAKSASVVHLIASSIIFPGVDLKEKKVVIQHGGTTYRENHEAINGFFNEYTDATIIQCPDLLGLGAVNEHWIYYPVDTDFIRPKTFLNNNKLKIGHFPSNPDIKGTKTIYSVIKTLEKEYPKRFEYIGTKDGTWGKEFIKNSLVHWTDNLKRLQECDIVIETLNPDINNRRFGEWGNTAIEAAAMGKIVITNCLSIDKYEKEFGECKLTIANDKKMLYNKLKVILELSDPELTEMKVRSRKWVEERHSMEATAKRIWDKVYSNFF